jgi:hypothetical protein
MISKKNTYKFLLLILAIFSGCYYSYSQDVALISPYIQLQYFKDNDNKSLLKTTLTYSKNRMELPLPGMKISFYSGTLKEKKIAEVITDEKGAAIFNVSLDNLLINDGKGSWPFTSDFEGNDTIEAASAEISVRNINLEMELNVIDTIKTVLVTAYTTEKGTRIPVTGEIVTLYVPRMFSLLPMGEITLDDSGSGTVEFPNDLPGDKEGNLKILARIEDHPDYGTIEKSSTVNWGTVPGLSIPSTHRALWTKTAPRWMIYTLTILLTGVWGHYLYTVICLIRIKRNSGKVKPGDLT